MRDRSTDSSHSHRVLAATREALHHSLTIALASSHLCVCWRQTKENADERVRREKSAVGVQSAFRMFAARQLLRREIRALFVKEFDPKRQVAVYRNTFSGARSLRKPFGLGSEELEYPDQWHLLEDQVSGASLCLVMSKSVVLMWTYCGRIVDAMWTQASTSSTIRGECSRAGTSQTTVASALRAQARRSLRYGSRTTTRSAAGRALSSRQRRWACR